MRRKIDLKHKQKMKHIEDKTNKKMEDLKKNQKKVDLEDEDLKKYSDLEIWNLETEEIENTKRIKKPVDDDVLVIGTTLSKEERFTLAHPPSTA